MNHLSTLLRTFPRKKLFIFGILLAILSVILNLFFSFLLKMLIDYAMDKKLDYFYNILIIILICIALELIFTYSKSKCIGIYTEGGINKLRNLFAQKINRMDYDTLNKSHSGELTSIATNDITRIKGFTTNTLPELIRIPLMAIGALICLFILSWKLTLVCLIVIPILIIGSNFLSKPINKISSNLQEQLAVVNAISTDFIKGVEISKSYNIEQIIEHKYQSSVDESIRLGKELAKRRAILESFSMVLSIIPFIATFMLGGYFVYKNDISVGGLLAFINLLNHLTFPLSRIPTIVADAMSELVSFNRLTELFNQKEERQDGTSHEFIISNPMIEFRNVHFTYPNQTEYVLKNVNFTINHLDPIAFVGPSGSGKSTVIKLILGYYDSYEGEIYVGGHELRTWHLSALRNYLSLVSQDTYLFPESIEENISYGSGQFNQDFILKSAKLANAHSFIELMKEGYQTSIGELGNTLSGGQKQRLSIARAIYKDAPILLLDEATSSLDNESEKIVQDALNHIVLNKTSLIIAHRLSTIKHVNKIFVLKDGQLVEQGTHEELYQLNGIYKELYKKQLESEVCVSEE